MQKNKNKLDKINIYFFSILYASLIFGFGIDENLNLGSKQIGMELTFLL